MPRRWTEEELRWLRENYAATGLRAIEGAFEERFGYSRGKRAIAAKAHKLGLHCKRLDRVSRTGATVKMFWGREPEATAWMLANDKGRVSDTVEAFEREFGIRLSNTQVSQFRQSHGTQCRRDCKGRYGDRYPVGSRRDTGRGYVLVKVRESPEVKGTKDNWEMEHVLAYERAYGPVPEGCQVMFCDHDYSNVDPSNLMAVPKRLAGIMNRESKWWDRPSMEAAVNAARLRVAITDKMLHPRRCEVCGKEFTPGKRYQTEIKTCPRCLEAGRKARGARWPASS